ncbi:cytochrome d ubiquinol oxidase subunit II [Pseudomonas vlassakiae]|jgi:cytochrome d ubiquinol oxidase subunit II|uniref:cytochrome d ubiquinol oxidase subunit II n=1 Tax=Pseudomonas TaxID=286 RepID=UPI000C1868BE|nr:MULTISPECIES: cytochrome d ubiquinol oxidase subunit II [unclassified Pseudomonas]AXQ47789.1 cytochrome d ubiquinol oxidase subunit II [Stenotrophomonas rhizophila]MBS3184633.1 cytochrome d ubiquinol oxidase subunit II [Pseudomonas sp. PCH44]PIK78440.1 cytochrome D oxidase subunit II [Pseudomonas sp. 382]
MLEGDVIVLLSAAALAFSVLSYVLLDGTDLGVGILLGLTRSAGRRRAMAVSILPIWDANETWLVLGGGGLLALFPLAYAVLLPALYLPFIVMFLALIMRAMALEFRDYTQSPTLKRGIDALHTCGSLIAGGCQGAALGTLVQGISSRNGQFTGTGWEWLSPFALYCAGVLVVGYAWLGACWLYWRSEGDLQRTSRRQAQCLAAATLVLLMVLLIWTSGLNPGYAQRIFNPVVLGAMGGTGLFAFIAFALSFRSRYDVVPLICALSVFVLAFTLMVVTLFPLIVPPSLTLFSAASGRTSQTFMLAGFVLLMPVTFFYNTFGFRVFSGKVHVWGRGAP